MAAIADYRDTIERVLQEYAAIPYSYGDIRSVVLFDRTRDRYALLSVGWDKHRVHNCVAHVDIIDGKVWIQCDNTEQGVAPDLEAGGIPREQIVLGFRRPEVRPHTGYAVA
jgi:hypothetical protein